MAFPWEIFLAWAVNRGLLTFFVKHSMQCYASYAQAAPEFGGAVPQWLSEEAGEQYMLFGSAFWKKGILVRYAYISRDARISHERKQWIWFHSKWKGTNK